MNLSMQERTLRPTTDLTEPDLEPVAEQRTALDGTNLSLAATDGRVSADGEVMLEFLAWSGYVGRPDVIDMQRIKARALGARVVSVDNLGVGDGTDFIPEYKRLRIRNGDFGSVSRSQLDVLRQDDTVQRGQAVSLMGHSLGASMAASFARQMPEGSRVDRLILWEAAGIRQQRFERLAGKFAWEASKWWTGYKNENPSWMNQPGQDKTFVRRVRQNRAGYVDYPRGLAKGTLVSDIVAARERETIDKDTEIIILHGEKSKVSSPKDNAYLVENLLAHGVKPKVWQQHTDESHGIIDSANRIDAILSEFRQSAT